MRRILFKTSTSLVLGLALILTLAVSAEQLAKSGTTTIHSAYKGVGNITQTGENPMYWTGVFWGVSFNDDGKGRSPENQVVR